MASTSMKVTAGKLSYKVGQMPTPVQLQSFLSRLTNPAQPLQRSRGRGPEHGTVAGWQ